MQSLLQEVPERQGSIEMLEVSTSGVPRVQGILQVKSD